MIKEIALDPELFCQWEHHLALRNEFAVEKGRLIAGFPKKWKGLLRAATDDLESKGVLPPVKAVTIRNWLTVPNGQCDLRFTPSSAAYNGEKQWHLNAEDQAGFFSVILSHRELNAPNAVRADDNIEYLKDPKFAAVTQRRLPRTSQGIVDCVWPLIRASSGTIKIVEPNFNPVETRFMRPFVTLLDRLPSTTIREVELHVLRPDAFSDHTLRNYRNHIDPELRSGYQVKVYFWGHRIEQLHDRYLLTDHGGIELSFGWDEGKLPNETTVAKILEDHLWKQEWDRYRIGSADFNLDPARHVLTIGTAA